MSAWNSMAAWFALTVRLILRLWQRPDFRRNPINAIRRRLMWRARWMFSRQPWCLPLAKNARILVPKGGAGALIYYLGVSEPETVSFLLSFLRPGMVFWDVGAHLGEYSVLAGKLVGDNGRVDAFEPHPGIFEFLQQNIEINGLTNVAPHQVAITDRAGMATLVLPSEPSLAHLSSPDRVQRTDTALIATWSLVDFYKNENRPPDLIKVDVEGAERLVLQGALPLLRLPPESAPVWIMEFASENCVRYEYSPTELLAELSRHGYRSYRLSSTGLLDGEVDTDTSGWSGNFVATKRGLGAVRYAR